MTVHGLAASPAARAESCSGCVVGRLEAGVHIHERIVWGQRMLYREAGSPDKPTVLLLHGMTTTAWNITHLLHALASDFHVIAPDHVGAGLLPAPAPGTAENAIATMSAHLDALIRLLGITSMAVVAQDIAACIAGEVLAARRPRRAVWAVAVEELPAGTQVPAPAGRSPFTPAANAALGAGGLAAMSATSALLSHGLPVATFRARSDDAERDDAVAHWYRTDREGAPVGHELCRLGQWLRHFLLRHAPDPGL
jgi:pimeloyl-ACP methyl ester carboxylesterase